MNPRFPIYVVSKGRAASRWTVRALELLGVPYHVVVEPSEFAEYAAVIDPVRLVQLDPIFRDEYEPCMPVVDGKLGPGPARNCAWAHALERGAAWHWVMDDNIKSFHRLNYNLKVPCGDGTIFRCMEDFVLRYTNVAMAGPNYFMFASRKTRMPPFTLNTRIYSCNLIRNDLPFRWRGRYNEDTDLSLSMLKAGWCTVQFNAFLQYKLPTGQMRGGNTDEFYTREGTLPKSRLLAAMHPDVARVVWRFGRWHHHVDYRRFRAQRLVRRPELTVADGVDDYGMTLQSRESPWRRA